jgi:hypothetical protein
MLGFTAAVAVPARAETIRLSGTIPFSFVVGDRTMPAGEYTLSETAAVPGRWVISGRADRAGSFLVTSASKKKSAGETPKLVFSRYEDRYFLSQIWTSAADHVFQAPVSRTERRVARTIAARGTTMVAVR